MNELVQLAVAEILAEIDRRTLLGAAYDTMSEMGKARFRASLTSILAALAEARVIDH